MSEKLIDSFAMTGDVGLGARGAQQFMHRLERACLVFGHDPDELYGVVGDQLQQRTTCGLDLPFVGRLPRRSVFDEEVYGLEMGSDVFTVRLARLPAD